MPSEHSRLSPSAAHRWIRCPASLAEIERNCPTERKSSAYADEGTAAHELAERVLRDGLYDCLELEGVVAENGIVFDLEMCQFVNRYIKAVRDFAQGHTLHIEQRVDLSHTIGVPDSFGTADAIVLTADGLELQLHDLKFGRGVQVFAEQNEQLMLYAHGCLREYDLLGDIQHVRLVIHQPRLNHLDEWVISVANLREFAKTARTAAIKAVKLADEGTDADLLSAMSAGAKQCRFCPVKATCPAQVKLAATSMGVRFDDMLSGANKAEVEKAISRTTQLTNGEIAALLPVLDTIVDWTKAVRAKAETELLAGHEVPGYKLVEGKKGPRAWVDEATVEDMLKGMRLKNDEMYTMKLQTPTYFEKFFKDSPVRWNRLMEKIAQADGKPSVAPLSDKRPALRMDADMSSLAVRETETVDQ